MKLFQQVKLARFCAGRRIGLSSCQQLRHVTRVCAVRSIGLVSPFPRRAVLTYSCVNPCASGNPKPTTIACTLAVCATRVLLFVLPPTSTGTFALPCTASPCPVPRQDFPEHSCSTFRSRSVTRVVRCKELSVAPTCHLSLFPRASTTPRPVVIGNTRPETSQILRGKLSNDTAQSSCPPAFRSSSIESIRCGSRSPLRLSLTVSIALEASPGIPSSLLSAPRMLPSEHRCFYSQRIVQDSISRRSGPRIPGPTRCRRLRHWPLRSSVLPPARPCPLHQALMDCIVLLETARNRSRSWRSSLDRPSLCLPSLLRTSDAQSLQAILEPTGELISTR